MDKSELAFVEAIYADEQSDAPRLIYADWLDEQGRADRASLIRVQCEMARCQEGSANFLKLKQRESKLILSLDAAKEFAGLKVAGIRAWKLRRGMIEVLTLNAERHLKNANRLLKHVPSIREMKLNKLRGVFAAFLEVKWLERLTSLNLSDNGLGVTRMLQLAEVSGLRNLRTLSVRNNKITPRGARALLTSPHLSQLRRLELNQEDFARQSELAVEGSDWEQLEELYMIISAPRGRHFRQLLTDLLDINHRCKIELNLQGSPDKDLDELMSRYPGRVEVVSSW
ncbi:MAG: TIGR02996 domain-containing protein [Planctomycetales bacterium]|nr:TIGR02996 domain-containing protein [Planctomycetales bacterium]